jgi:hypothetical protein
MDLTAEIETYQALLRCAIDDGNTDLRREIQYQREVLRSLGVTDAQVLNLIHDRYQRAKITHARAERAERAGGLGTSGGRYYASRLQQACSKRGFG